MEAYLFVAGGLVALMFGGEGLVRGAAGVAERLGVSPLLIGITMVGFGTSTPELVTSLQAAFLGSPGVAIGNVIGSNIANILLILGVAALIAPVLIARDTFKRDGPVLAGVTLICVAAVAYGALGVAVGVVFLILLAAYLWFAVRQERARVIPEGVEALAAPPPPLIRSLPLLLGGLALTLLGARYLVLGAIELAGALGVDDAIVGLTVVAVGTSLPELAASVSAARRGQTDIAYGNVIGSNIFNVLFILGVTAVVHPIEVPDAITWVDLAVLIASAGALIGLALQGWKIVRWQGAALLAFYGAYVVWLGVSA